MIAIGEASRQSGVSIETIRYYEREGIVSPAERTASGRRVYGASAVAELRLFRRCRDPGFSIPETRALRRLSQQPSAACANVEAMGRQQIADMRGKIAQLRKLEAALQELLSSCAAGNTACPMLRRLMTGRSPPQAPLIRRPGDSEARRKSDVLPTVHRPANSGDFRPLTLSPACLRIGHHAEQFKHDRHAQKRGAAGGVERRRYLNQIGPHDIHPLQQPRHQQRLV